MAFNPILCGKPEPRICLEHMLQPALSRTAPPRTKKQWFVERFNRTSNVLPAANGFFCPCHLCINSGATRRPLLNLKSALLLFCKTQDMPSIEVFEFRVFSFSLWNTLMGVSLLSMPWALYQVRSLLQQELTTIEAIEVTTSPVTLIG